MLNDRFCDIFNLGVITWSFLGSFNVIGWRWPHFRGEIGNFDVRVEKVPALVFWLNDRHTVAFLDVEHVLVDPDFFADLDKLLHIDFLPIHLLHIAGGEEAVAVFLNEGFHGGLEIEARLSWLENRMAQRAPPIFLSLELLMIVELSRNLHTSNRIIGRGECKKKKIN